MSVAVIEDKFLDTESDANPGSKSSFELLFEALLAHTLSTKLVAPLLNIDRSG